MNRKWKETTGAIYTTHARLTRQQRERAVLLEASTSIAQSRCLPQELVHILTRIQGTHSNSNNLATAVIKPTDMSLFMLHKFEDSIMSLNRDVIETCTCRQARRQDTYYTAHVYVYTDWGLIRLITIISVITPAAGHNPRHHMCPVFTVQAV